MNSPSEIPLLFPLHSFTYPETHDPQTLRILFDPELSADLDALTESYPDPEFDLWSAQYKIVSSPLI